MTDREKLEKLKKLADAMYYAAFNLTTDASRLKKAMYDYHQFIIQKLHKKEPVSEDLEKASKEWLSPQLDKSYAAYGETKQMELTRFDGYAMLDAIEFGAQWQKNKDALTWEDISILRQIMYVYNGEIRNEMRVPIDEDYCKEVLKRFNLEKYGKEG